MTFSVLLLLAPEMLSASVSSLSFSSHYSSLICSHIGKKSLGGDFTSWAASLVAKSVLDHLAAITYTY